MLRKTKWYEKAIIALIFVIPAGLFLLKFSAIRYPFIHAHYWLAGHLKEDFAITLPASASVLNSYWVGSHDPEEVFEVQMSASDAIDLANRMETAATIHGYTVQTPPHLPGPPLTALMMVHPPYVCPNLVE